MKSFIASIALGAFTTCSTNLFAATTVTLDFENATLGAFTSSSPLQIADGIGGMWTLTPSSTSGTTYSIVDKGGDKELRLTDVGSTPGSFVLNISHSEGAFTQISGGNYEAGAALGIGHFRYQRELMTIYSDTNPISTATDTAISFGAQPATTTAKLSGNGLFSSGTNIQVDVDDLVFSVSPEPSSSILLCLGGLLLASRRTR